MAGVAGDDSMADIGDDDTPEGVDEGEGGGDIVMLFPPPMLPKSFFGAGVDEKELTLKLALGGGDEGPAASAKEETSDRVEGVDGESLGLLFRHLPPPSALKQGCIGLPQVVLFRPGVRQQPHFLTVRPGKRKGENICQWPIL